MEKRKQMQLHQKATEKIKGGVNSKQNKKKLFFREREETSQHDFAMNCVLFTTHSIISKLFLYPTKYSRENHHGIQSVISDL